MRRAATILDWVLGLLMAVLFAAVCVQVFARYLLNFSFAWSEEFPVLLFSWLVFLGSAAALAEGRHLGIAFLQDMLPARLRWGVRCLVDVAVLGFLVFAIVNGVKLAKVFGHYEFVSIPFSRYWLFVAVPVGCLLMIPVAIRDLLNTLWGHPTPPQPPIGGQGQLS